MTGPQWDYRDAPPAPPAPFVPSLPRSTRPAQGLPPLPKRAGVPPWHPDYQLAAARGEIQRLNEGHRSGLSGHWRVLLKPLTRGRSVQVVTGRLSALKATEFWGAAWDRVFTVTTQGDIQTIKRVR